MDDIATERLDLHLLTIAEAEWILSGRRPPKSRWAVDYPTEGDVSAARRFLKDCADGADPSPFGCFEIRLRASGLAIGGIGFHGAPTAEGTVTIGYGLTPETRGRGYATEALRALLLFAREQGALRVEGDADLDNVASQRVMEAAGMREVRRDEQLVFFRAGLGDPTR